MIDTFATLMNNAVNLAEALARDEVDEALEGWSVRETETSRSLVRLGRKLEEALIWSVPDFGQMDAATMQTW